MHFQFEEPDGRERRPEWPAVPASIIHQLEKLLKEKIVAGEIAYGGYSPSADFVVTLASGKKVFIKGTYPGDDTHGTQTLRQEVAIYQGFSAIRDFAPRYIGCVGDGGEDGWMLGVFEYIETIPTLPWTEEKLEKVFRHLSRLHFCDEKNIPEVFLPAREKNYVGQFLQASNGWLRIRDDETVSAKFLSLFEDKNAGHLWLETVLPILCDWQNKAPEMGGPVGIIHQDLRSDNILFGRQGRAYLIDWPNTCYGPIALDLVYFLSSISAESNFEPQELLGLYQKISGVEIEKAALQAALASLSGHMANNAYRAVPAKLPRLRWLQKSLLWAMLQWAAVLMDLPAPPRFKGLP